jgi:hypothetical protein
MRHLWSQLPRVGRQHAGMFDKSQHVIAYCYRVFSTTDTDKEKMTGTFQLLSTSLNLLSGK